jgi:hypothetical protein
VQILIDKELRASDTDTFQSIQNVREELDEIDRTSELEMPEMSGASMIRLPT